MKAILKIFSVTLVLLALFYFALLKILSESAQGIDADKTIANPYSQSAIFRFNKIEPFISLGEIGYKISGIEERNENEIIKYNDYLYVFFNPFLLNFYIKYKGGSEIINHNGKFFADIDVLQSFILNFKLSTYIALFKTNYTLLKYIKLINLDIKKLRIWQENKEGDLFNINDSYLSFKTKFKKYKNFEDLISNLPNLYNLSGFVNMNSGLTKDLLGFNSLLMWNPSKYSFYGPFFIQLDSKSPKFNLKKPLDNSKIRFICNQCRSDLFNFSGELNTHINNDDKSIQAKCTISLSKDFFKNLPSWYHNLLFIIKGFSQESVRILQKPEKSFSTEILTKDYFFDFFIQYSLSDEILSAKIPFMIVKSEETGLSLSGDFKFTNDFDYKLDSSIVLLNAKRIVDYWTRFLIKEIEQDKDMPNSAINLNSDINYNFLKSISEYPKSISKDLMLNVKLDSEANIGKIGKYDFFGILDKYFEIKTNVILQNAKNSDNPFGYIKKNVPELSEQTIIDLLSASNEREIISDKKWEKLIE